MNRIEKLAIYPDYVRAENCTTCRHLALMGYPLPQDDITEQIAESLCPNCRAELPFEKLRCPVSAEAMESLYAFLEEYLEESDCGHNFAGTSAFSKQQDLPTEPLLAWLRGHGADCDCEVLFNIATRFGDS